MKRFGTVLLCIFFTCGIYETYAANPADVYGSMKWLINKQTPVDNTYICDVGISDFSLTAEIEFDSLPTDTDKSYSFLYFRCVDIKNGYALKINSLRSVLSIYKVTDNNYTWMLNIPKLLADDQILRLKIDACGDQFHVFVGTKSYSYFQKPMASFMDNSFQGGKILLQKPSDCKGMTIHTLYIRELVSPADYQTSKEPQPLVREYKNPYLQWTDCAGHRFGGAIRFLASRSIVNGKFTNAFYPDNPIQANEFIKILVLAKGISVQENSSHWAKPYIDAAVRNGLISADAFDDYTVTVGRRAAAKILGLCDLPVLPDAPLTRGEACAWIAGTLNSSYQYDSSIVTASYSEYERAFTNPLKGLRGNALDAELSNPFITLLHCNIPWNKIESSASDGADKITSYCNGIWKNYPNENIKVIPRVILQFNDSTYWPADMTKGDFTSQEFCDRLAALIQKLGHSWDNDPRVAFVQMGIIGNWGEMQNPYPTAKIRAILQTAFTDAFQNKYVQANLMLSNSSIDTGRIGWYWDSFGHWDNLGVLDGCAEIKWQNVPFGGEAAFDWGNTLGKNPDDALLNYSDRYKELIRFSHASYLGWISRYTQTDEKISKHAEEIQKTLGYRFVITDAAYTGSAKQGNTARLTLHVVNSGNAPMYYNWPIQLALLDDTTHQPVWHKNIDCDITSWLPSNDSAEKIYSVETEFKTPPLSDGKYVLAVAIAEPGGDFPSLRFANTNYYNGGYTALGNFCISCENNSPYITDGFNDLQSERLKYAISTNRRN